LSTSIPIPSAKPPRDIIFNETEKMFIGAKVAIIDTGMVRPIIKVLNRFLRKKYKTIIARIPPIIAVLRTSSIELLINTDWSVNVWICIPSGNVYDKKFVIRLSVSESVSSVPPELRFFTNCC